jgi:hypothetical protein
MYHPIYVDNWFVLKKKNVIIQDGYIILFPIYVKIKFFPFERFYMDPPYSGFS